MTCKELKILPGKHCNKDMKIMLMVVEVGVCWIVYGICKRCNSVIMLSILMIATEPIQDTDFTIDYNINATGGIEV